MRTVSNRTETSPDTLHTIWPDWMRADLKPDYVENYRPFLEQVLRVAPDMPLMIQADIGSQKQNRRSWAWIAAFEHACAALGVGSTTCYEYFIGDYMYTDPPHLVEVRRQRKGIELYFTKWLAASVAGLSHYTLSRGRITAARLDGSVVFLTLDGLRDGDLATLTVRNLSDDAGRRLFPGSPPAVLPSYSVRFR